MPDLFPLPLSLYPSPSFTPSLFFPPSLPPPFSRDDVLTPPHPPPNPPLPLSSIAGTTACAYVQENGKTLGPKDSEQLTALLAHHADADAKSKDVDHFIVGPHPTFASKCFIIVRKDGTKVRVRSALVHLLLPSLGFVYSGLAWFCPSAVGRLYCPCLWVIVLCDVQAAFVVLVLCRSRVSALAK